MKIIARGRAQGKTEELIRMSAETGDYIVTASHHEAWRIAQTAKAMGLTIPFPLTAYEFQQGQYHGGGVRGLLIDNAELVLRAMSAVPVLAISLTLDAEAVAEGAE